MPVSPGLLGPPAPTDRWRAVAVASVVGLVAGLLRLRGLDHPAELVFDETYYAKDAWALLQTGAEREWADAADEQILAGDLSGLTQQASFASHPPWGKWMIAAGQAVAGMTPVGWRLGVAVLGTLAAVVMVYVARRVTRSTLLGGLAGLLVALDGLAIVTSRIAVLDGMLMFWVLLAVAFLVRDRDWSRSWMAARLDARERDRAVTPVLEGAAPRDTDPTPAPPADSEPAARDDERDEPPLPLWRPWRLMAGIAVGLACATKWSGVPVLGVVGLLTVVWQAGALANAGSRRPVRRALLVDAPMAAVTVVGAALITYLATWAGWLTSDDGYERQWAAGNPASGPVGEIVPDALRSLWHYHAVAYGLLADLDSEHTWQSGPLGWLVLVRPVLFYRDKPTQGVDGCQAQECVADILALGTPLTWWVGVLALAFMFFRAVARDDWRAWLVIVVAGASWLPWFGFPDRPVFSFYAVVTLPFLVLGIVVALRMIPDALNRDGPAIADRGQRWMLVLGGGLLALTVVQLWFFWPILVGDPIPLEDWRLRIWLPGWS